MVFIVEGCKRKTSISTSVFLRVHATAVSALTNHLQMGIRGTAQTLLLLFPYSLNDHFVVYVDGSLTETAVACVHELHC